MCGVWTGPGVWHTQFWDRSPRRVVLGQGLVCGMCGVGTGPSNVWCWDRAWCVACVVMGRAPQLPGSGTRALLLNLVLHPVVLEAAWPPVMIIFDYKREVGDVGLLYSDAVRGKFHKRSWAACGCWMTSGWSSAEQRATWSSFGSRGLLWICCGI